MHPLTSLNASRPTSLQDVPQDRSAPTHGARVPQTSPPSPTILIVEDEPSIASALTEAMTQEILEPTDSGARGYYAVLRRVHEPLLASIFWLALGCVLWGPNKGVCDAYARVGGRGTLQKPRRGRRVVQGN
jgi:hypothetical protein